MTAVLLDGVDEGDIQLGELHSISGKPSRSIPIRRLSSRKATARTWRCTAQRGSPGGVDQLLPITQQKGNAVAGKEVFKKQLRQVSHAQW